MTADQNSIYKGYFITTRWATHDRPLEGTPRWFTASFSVDTPDPCGSSWQQFPRAVFGSFLAAMANALAGAMRSIDQDIAAAGGWGMMPPKPVDPPRPAPMAHH